VVVEAIDLILSKAKEHGLVAGIHNGTPAYAKAMIDKGFRLVTIGSDARLMMAGAARTVAEMREPSAPSPDRKSQSQPQPPATSY